MAIVWIYPPEILSLNIHAEGASVAAAADLLGNSLVIEIPPRALENIRCETYIVVAVLDIANALIVWWFYPETDRMGLEIMINS